MTKALITGISGFAGSFLAEHLISQKTYSIIGTYLSSNSLKNVASIKEKIKLVQLDLTKKENIYNLIEKERPDAIFHLAALPAVGESFDKPAETIVNNVVAQVHLLEAVRKTGIAKCRILIVSSADVYGRVSKEDIPIDEDTPFRPTNTYAVSKIAQDYLGLQYTITYNLKIVRVRPFNHFGPRQSLGYVVADFAKEIAKIEKGLHEPVLHVGNLEPRRDFTDVRDMVRAYHLLLEQGKVGEVYNVGSGRAYKIAEILDTLLELSHAKITVKKDPTLFRPQDSLNRVCDNRKFVKLTAWEPQIQIKQTLQDTLDYWRRII